MNRAVSVVSGVAVMILALSGGLLDSGTLAWAGTAAPKAQTVGAAQFKAPATAVAMPKVHAGYVLPESETWDLSSATGERYRIFVSHPEGKPPPPQGYPVLTVLDGNTIFASFAEARRLQGVGDSAISNSMIVAVGYPTDQPTDQPYDHVRRMYDFTPPFPDPLPVSSKPFASLKVGGQDRFVSFLLEVLRPELARRYPIDPHRQALFGHSLGGLFALHMLYRHPEAFNAIIAASPSIWWNDQQILGEERAFAARLAQSAVAMPIARVLLVMGEREETRAELWDGQALAQRLTKLSEFGLRSQFELFADEPHLGVPTRAITGTLRFAFAWP